jgi:hypothetical protein
MPPRKKSSTRRRLTIKSKKQQRFVFGVLVKRGVVPKSVAKSRAKKGKAFKRLPTRVKSRKSGRRKKR